jgi:hypothetical protein
MDDIKLFLVNCSSVGRINIDSNKRIIVYPLGTLKKSTIQVESDEYYCQLMFFLYLLKQKV